MNLGYYYHVNTVFDGVGNARLPSHLGAFLRELASRVGHVTYFAHGGEPTGVEDFELRPPLVTAVDLGPRRSFPARSFWPAPALKRFAPKARDLDAMLIRGPSPLLPHLADACRCPVALHLVGDYANWLPRASEPRWRNMLIAAWVRWYKLQERRTVRRCLVLVNNDAQLKEFQAIHRHVFEVFTSSLSAATVRASEPVAWPPSKGTTEPIRLLYTGRIVREKGLREATDAVAILGSRGITATLDVVGWEDPRDPTVSDLQEHARQQGVEGRVRFPGYRPAGAELATEYACADVYVLPSYWEGFPRSVIEAMAMGLPVVASRLPGLESRLQDRQTALFVQPRSAAALADAIETLLRDRDLCLRISRSGWAWAKEFTIERSAELIVGHLKRWVEAGLAAAETKTASGSSPGSA